MLAKYFILCFAGLSFAAGDFIHDKPASRDVNAEIDAWETEIEKTITVKLKNKIEEILEKRLQERLEKILEELFKNKLKGVRSCCTKDKQEPLAWIQTTAKDSLALSDCAVVGGYEGHDNSPLWVIRAKHDGDLIPGKLAAKHRTAFVAADGTETPVDDIEVFCAKPDKVRWVKSHGYIPRNAIKAGLTSTGLPLYIGRAKEGKSLTVGKIQQKTLFISFAGKQIPHNDYEILCLV